MTETTYARLFPGGPIVKHPEGAPLPLVKSRALKRAERSRYEPHVGKKQLAKLNQNNQ